MKHLILGGVRSGKSRLAEQTALACGQAVTYIATARDDGDAELSQRIQSHRDSRPAHWRVIEAPLELAAALQQQAASDRCLLVDCLTLWMTNLLCHPDPGCLARERDALLQRLPQLPGTLILVGNETGLGVIPLGELTRRYVDEAGQLHQRLAQCCDRVVFTIAGLPLVLKDSTT